MNAPKREPTIGDFYWDMMMYWRYAGEDVRKEILSDLTKEPLPTTKVPDADCRFTVDYSNDRYKCGSSCVYAWVTDKYEIIYIGCGSVQRATNVNGRNKAFANRYMKENIKPYIIAINVIKPEAEKIETLCIMEAQLKGWRIENKTKLLTQSELVLLMQSDSETKEREKYEDLVFQYQESYDAFTALNKYCVKCIERNEICRDKYLVNGEEEKQKSERKAIRHMWTIDGVTKPGKDWCNEYKIGIGQVLDRMNNRGCTPKEALTFPRYTRSNKRGVDIVQWWKDNGYVPGTDSTSCITPISEWPEEYRAM